MASYKDMEKGEELLAAYTKYKAWQKKTKAQKQTAYKAVAKDKAKKVKIERELAHIIPFQAKVGTTLRYQAYVLPDTPAGTGAATASVAQDLVKDRIVKGNLAAGLSSVKVQNFKFAKIIASRRTETSPDNTDKSRFTDNPYARHRSDNVSCNFGRLNAESVGAYEDAVKAIRNKAEFETFNNVVGNRIGFVPEG